MRVERAIAHQSPKIPRELVMDKTDGKPAVPMLFPLASTGIPDQERVLAAAEVILPVADSLDRLTTADTVEVRAIEDVHIAS